MYEFNIVKNLGYVCTVFILYLGNQHTNSATMLCDQLVVMLQGFLVELQFRCEVGACEIEVNFQELIFL